MDCCDLLLDCCDLLLECCDLSQLWSEGRSAASGDVSVSVWLGIELVGCVLVASFYGVHTTCPPRSFPVLSALGRSTAGINPRTPKFWSAATCRSFGLKERSAASGDVAVSVWLGIELVGCVSLASFYGVHTTCPPRHYPLLSALGRSIAGINPRTPKFWSAATCRSFGLREGLQRVEM